MIEQADRDIDFKSHVSLYTQEAATETRDLRHGGGLRLANVAGI